MIPTKETLSVEFKSDQRTLGESIIVDEVVALSNSEGGDLYIGVEDDGEVTGAQPAHRDPIQVAAMVANKTVPPVSVRAETLAEKFPVMHIEVPRSRSIVATSNGRILRRRIKSDGTPESVPMYPYEIATRLSDLGRLDYSAQPVVDATCDDFDSLELARLRRLVQTSRGGDRALLELADDELERALKLTTRVGEKDVPTLAGLLMVGKAESLERLVPTHEAVFQVLEGTDIRANESYRQPLLYTIEDIIARVEPWNPVTEVQIGLLSQPTPLYDRRALREAIVNAFGHRDYSVLGRVRVQMDDAGLSVNNPGGFIEGISVRNLLSAEPQGRNPCLMDALKRVGLAERTGRGIDRIYEGSLLYGRPLPDYSASNQTMVSLFIERSEPDAEFVQLLAEERDRGTDLSLQSLLVLDALKRSRRCGVAELSEMVDIPHQRLRRTVELLCEAGLVEASGVGQNRSYMLSKKVYGHGGKAKEYVRQTDIDRVRYPELIMKLARQQGRVTVSDVRELLHLPDGDAAYYELKKLKEHGELTLVKKGPRSFYAPAKM